MDKERFWHPMSEEPPCNIVLFVKKLIHYDDEYISYGTDVYEGNGVWQQDKYTIRSEKCTTPIAKFDVLFWAYIPESD